MAQPVKNPLPKPKPARTDPKQAAAQQQNKAERAEVLGRHKNAGQKDHKGAR